MRKDTEAGAYIKFPYDDGRSFVLENLFAIWTTVLAITETLRVEATELALGSDVVKSVPFHIRRTCRRRQKELAQSTVDSRRHVLPEKRAVLHAKGHEHATLFLISGIHLPGIVSANIDRVACNHGTAKRVVSQLDAPDDVSPGLRIPINRRITLFSRHRLGLWRDGQWRRNS